MGSQYLIDSNVIIDIIGKLPDAAKVFFPSVELTISAVTKIEILGWYNASDVQLAPVYEFIEFTDVISINEMIVDKSIAIRQKKKVGLGDAIIAATALVYDLTLIHREYCGFYKDRRPAIY